MGLFDFLKGKKSEESREFEEKIVVTENVNEELLKTAQYYNIPLSSLDFDILNVKTYIKTEDDFILADEETLALMQDKDFLMDEHNEIKQVYEIKIRKYVPEDGFEIVGELKANKLLTFAKFVLFPESDLREFTEIKMYEELNKKKLKSSFLIQIFDKEMKEDIKKLGSILLVSGLIEENFEIRLCRGIDPVEKVDGKVVYHFKKNKTSLKKEFIYPVKKDEVVIEVIKPKEGKNGRDCRGKLIKIKPIKSFEIPNIEFDPESIKKEENEDNILYIAKKGGYIVVEDGKYYIKEELEVRQINIKTGNIQDGDESEVKLDVKEKDVLKEAIADDMVVETKELIVRGNVGNKAKVKAEKLTIEGQTHKNSLIAAVNAHINTHKGKLKAKEANINFLEGGYVKAKNVKIKSALGGVIIGENVEIENLLSHAKIYALNTIKIHNLKGEENKLAIAPQVVLEDTNIEKMEKEIEEIKRHINFLKKEAAKIKGLLDKNKSAYEELKNIYLANRAQNKKTSNVVIAKLKEYQMFVKKFKELEEKIKKLERDKNYLIETIENLQNAIYNATIVSLSPWKPFNRIEFDIVYPPVKLTYDTKGNEGVCGFKLRDFGDTFKIVKVKVENDSGS